MIYAMVLLAITDREKLAAYRNAAGSVLARHDGKLVAAAPEPTVLEGTITAPDIAAVLSFPERESALAWINDPDLKDVHELRRTGADSSIILLA